MTILKLIQLSCSGEHPFLEQPEYVDNWPLCDALEAGQKQIDFSMRDATAAMCENSMTIFSLFHKA
jgi:hypothetical protein